MSDEDCFLILNIALVRLISIACPPLLDLFSVLVSDELWRIPGVRKKGASLAFFTAICFSFDVANMRGLCLSKCVMGLSGCYIGAGSIPAVPSSAIMLLSALSILCTFLKFNFGWNRCCA